MTTQSGSGVVSTLSSTSDQQVPATDTTGVLDIVTPSQAGTITTATSTATLLAFDTVDAATTSAVTLDGGGGRRFDPLFSLAVVSASTAILLPVFSGLSNPTVRDSLIALSAPIWVISITCIVFHDLFHSRSRFFRNMITAILAFVFFVWSFQATAPYSFTWLPLAVNVAVVINAQEPPWTCTLSRRQRPDILPTYHDRHGNDYR